MKLDYTLKHRDFPRDLLITDQFDPLWWADNKIVSHLANVLSVCLCDFERFFCVIAREVLPLVHDVELQKILKTFISQEAGHTRMHNQYNDLLQGVGYFKLSNLTESNSYFMGVIGMNEDQQDIRLRLHYAVMIELYTARFSRFFLELLDDHIDAIDPAIGYLMGFHANEECEHRAVLFDVYSDIFGEKPNIDPNNVAIWKKLEVNLINSIINCIAYMISVDVLRDDDEISSKQVKAKIKSVLCGPGGSFPDGFICQEYGHKDFHPYYSDINDEQLIEKWDTQYEPYLLSKLNL